MRTIQLTALLFAGVVWLTGCDSSDTETADTGAQTSNAGNPQNDSAAADSSSPAATADQPAGGTGAQTASSSSGGLYIPADADPTCTVSATDLAGWFTLQEITENGPVAVPDSVNFDDSTDCNFYQWSWQMFLWLTSNAIGTYDPDAMVLDSPAFYDVSPADANGQRTLRADENPNFPLRTRKLDVGETAEAGSGAVLISQNNAVVYFGVHVNDIYAWLRTGQASTTDPDPTLASYTEFPTDQTQLDAIVSYMQTQGASTQDSRALAMELKTSWVAADTVSDASRFILIDAEVPAFDQAANATTWERTGTETRQLALVGLHIVGTVAGHPEMVWATIEHLDNAPDNTYVYNNDQGGQTTVDYDSSGYWTFMTNGGAIPDDTTVNFTMDDNGNIVSSGPDIGPVDTYRMNPWGSANTTADSAATNTDIISLNHSVLSQLIDGDVRKNYALIGAVWTSDGTIPDQAGFTLTGTVDLANTTMETFEQTTNCFTCHNNGTTSGASGFNISHIYNDIQPLAASSNQDEGSTDDSDAEAASAN